MGRADFTERGDVRDEGYLTRVAEFVVCELTEDLGEDDAVAYTTEALARAIPGGKRPWTPECRHTFPVYVGRMAENLARNERKKRGRRAGLLEGRDLSPDGPPDAAEAALQVERHRRLGAYLREALADSPTVLPYVEQILDGVVSEEDVMARTTLTHDQLLKARARVSVLVGRWYEQHGPDVDSGSWEARA